MVGSRQLAGHHRDVTRQAVGGGDGAPALALFAALALVGWFAREHDLVEESWLRAAHWIGDNFDALGVAAKPLTGESRFVTKS
jgi:hypothetical protein